MTSGDAGETRPPFPWLPVALIAAGFLCMATAGAFWIQAQQRAQAEEAARRRAASPRMDTRTRAMPAPGDEVTTGAPESLGSIYRLPLAVAGVGLALDLAGSVLLVAGQLQKKARKARAKRARRR